MLGFNELLAAYLAAHPDVLPPADPGEDLRIERGDLGWKVSWRNGGEVFVATVSCESLLGWLWLQQAGQPKS